MIGATIGEYKILDRLGAGGMGEVYRAVHAKFGRVVAVKVLNQSRQSASFHQRFFNEAQVQAQLHHPNIAAMYDFLEYHNQPCIVMEYIDGQTLDELLRINGTLPIEFALNIYEKIVEAIAYVHDNGIIHRDIKLNNIKITAKGEVKLLDFGIAKSDSSPNLTVTGDVIGTLQYLSPEQIKGGSADERSDIWALGVVFYEMISGQAPFDATTLGRLCEKISKSDYVSPSTFNPSLPKEVEAIITRCLKKNAAARYQSARDILSDLTRLKIADTPQQEEKPVRSIEPVSLVWAKQNWKLCTLIFTVMLCVLTFFLMAMRKPDDQAFIPELINNQGQPARELKTVKINALEGKAEVYREGQLIGQTPYEIRAALGEQVSLTLKREGYADKRVDFAITEGKKEYTVVLNPVK